MWGSELAYRAIEGTNTKVRRLAYLTAIVSILGRTALNQQVLLTRLVRWSQEHKGHLDEYWSRTGEVTCTRRNSAGAYYLDWASALEIIASISGEYRLTRLGLTLLALKTVERDNPFILTDTERLFYTYLLLEKDADVLLTILGRLQEQPGIVLASLQKTYQQDLITRLTHKGRLIEDERLKEQLRDRRLAIETTWKKPARYAEHIVPPRLNWLLDLGFLETATFQRHQYDLTEAGSKFLGDLPRYNGAFCDVSALWLSADFWPLAATHLLNIQSGRLWNELAEEEQFTMGLSRLKEAFDTFHHSIIPKVSLTQVLLYMTVKLILENHILVSLAELTQWLSVPKTINGWCYQVRLSPQENVSYIVLTPA